MLREGALTYGLINRSLKTQSYEYNSPVSGGRDLVGGCIVILPLGFPRFGTMVHMKVLLIE